ncbi:hypothetical protein CDAR_53581 [Caerostris darwini]|uniref:Uncharacterized protein n=1 Tax=Caerostris darwini TaxID=1538125 RepID=A0AAV4VTB3_9ARAC|nr:hypothetical protein CDAR_53581 [Caerostris darwini]
MHNTRGGSNESMAAANYSSSNGLQSFSCRPPRPRPLSRHGSERFCRRGCFVERWLHMGTEAQTIVYSSCFCSEEISFLRHPSVQFC